MGLVKVLKEIFRLFPDLKKYQEEKDIRDEQLRFKFK